MKNNSAKEVSAPCPVRKPVTGAGMPFVSVRDESVNQQRRVRLSVAELTAHLELLRRPAHVKDECGRN